MTRIFQLVSALVVTAAVSLLITGCPKRLRGSAVTRRVAGTSVDISRLVRGRLKAGTVIVVEISGRDGGPATTKLTTRRSKPPKVS